MFPKVRVTLRNTYGVAAPSETVVSYGLRSARRVSSEPDRTLAGRDRNIPDVSKTKWEPGGPIPLHVSIFYIGLVG